MNPKRISVKFFVSPDPEMAVDLHPFIGIFHSFIQHETVEGLLIDVADYAHVPEGPGVVLIGHDVDYAIDLTDGRAGLLATRKNFGGEVPVPYVLRDTLRKALGTLRAIEAHPDAGLKFAMDPIEIQFADRLASPNTDAGYAAARAALEGPLQEVFGAGASLARGHTADSRTMLSLVVNVAQPADAGTLLERACAAVGGIRTKNDAPHPAPGAKPQTEWDVSAAEVEKLRDEGADFVLLDVREPAELEICTLNGTNIPSGQLQGRLNELEHDAHIIVHCRNGGRSSKAVEMLRAAGFGNVWNMNGGIIAWIDRIDSSLTRY